MRARPTSRTDRAQTTQDFAIGVGLFLLAVVFVVTFMPMVLAPFDTVDDTERMAQAERIASELVTSSTVEGERILLDSERLEDRLDDLDDPTVFGVPPWSSINVTVESFDGEATRYSGGEEFTGQSAETWVRIVTTTENCGDGCRLVVRVW